MPVTDRLPFLGDEPDLEAFLVRASKWASDLGYRQIPKPVRRAAKAQVASTVGAAIWTATHPLGDRIDGAVDKEGDPGCDADRATFLAGRDCPPAVAARGNAALSLALEFDDAVPGGHTGHSSVFVPLAYAESSGVSGERALVAVVAANEVAARLGAATASGPFHGQRAAYVHSVGAAVGRAVVEGDDAETLADALGTALLQPPWPLDPPFFGADARVWTASEPIGTGLQAIGSARAGLSGRPDLIEADAGFLENFASQPRETFLGDFGDRWHTQALSVKANPASAAVAAPIEAALDIRGRFDRGRTAIERVDVHAARPTLDAADGVSPYLDGPDTPIAALPYSVSYNVAAALVDGEHTPRQLGDRSKNVGIWKIADRVFLHHDAGFTATALRSDAVAGVAPVDGGLPALVDGARRLGVGGSIRHLPTVVGLARSGPVPTDLSSISPRIGARVEVSTTDGQTVESTIEHPTGFAGRPLAEVRAVARNKCRTGLQAAGVREALARERVDELLALESADGVSLTPLREAADRA